MPPAQPQRPLFLTAARSNLTVRSDIAGLPCEMDEIWTLARETGVAVVEDAAHAFPTSYQGRPIGSLPRDIAGSACFLLLRDEDAHDRRGRHARC